MIPVRLTLKNFLSYREATLDFNGLHVACICGANGAGKSSLLEAIAWSLWGQSRAVTEDDVIHLNEMEVRVDFVFCCHEQNYRVIRARQRGQSSTLEFQIETPQGFRSLTGKGMRATQQLITQCIKLDYDTFINSAYLRQGRADEFMLKRPSERKQILADLLKLDQYDLLAEQARERSRQHRAELSVLERSLQSLEQQLQQEMALGAEQQLLQDTLTQLQTQQEADEARLLQLRATQQQRQAWTQQLQLYQQQQQHLTQDCQRLRQERTTAEQQQQQLAGVLREAEAIAQGYAEFHSLQTEEEALTAKFHAHQAAANQRQQLQQQLSEQMVALKDPLSKLQTQRESFHQQAQELQHALRKADDIETAVRQLHQAREHLTYMDQRQMQVTPLLQRRQRIQSTLEIAQTRLSTRLEELQTATIQLQTQQQRQPLLRQAVGEIAELVEYLEQRKAYQQKVLEKGQERRNFMEQLQARQRDCERQLAELEQKMALLRKEEWVGERVDLSTGSRTEREAEEQVTLLQSPSSLLSYPPCPLCDRPLDERHWNVVVEHHQSDRQELLNQIWVIREQLAVSEREIQVLRQEYRDLDREMAHYAAALERRGQLQEQLQGSVVSEERLQQLMQEQVELERSLQTGGYAPELHEELEMLEATLEQLNYDDRDHALARGEVDRWRWAEIKQAEIKQAQRRQAQLLEKLPELDMQIADLEKQLTRLAESPLQIKLDRLDQQIAAIAYDLNHHTALRNALKKAQSWQLRHRELTQAQQQYPLVQKRIQELTQLLKERNQALQMLTEQIETLVHALEVTPDASNAIQLLERQIQEQRSQLDEYLARLGRLQQQQQQFEALREQLEQQQQEIQTLRRQSRVYHELAQAFGKNGIQALMIENVLPQLEAETNQILGRLSNFQLHIQFVTQRAGKRKAPHSRTGLKLIDTLDILIADAQGTRPYETYSGGEAFRINFAIRLALARLLAQRSGTALQLLIVDEGFGTQDEAGCDRLIAAIQAIASDFACILTVTHMPRLKEAFQTHIEVAKTEHGSCLSLSI